MESDGKGKRQKALRLTDDSENELTTTDSTWERILREANLIEEDRIGIRIFINLSS